MSCNINKLLQFSQQASHPKTQQMAADILEHTQIRRVDYLKLLNVYQFESSRIKEYPVNGTKKMNKF